MHILLLIKYNPFYEDGASANRFAGIIKGLLENDIKVTLVVTGGYMSVAEWKNKGCKFDMPNLRVCYTRHLVEGNIWLRRFNAYIMRRVTNGINAHRLRNYLCGEHDYVWLTNSRDILSAFVDCSDRVKSKTIIELNEFNDIYKGAGATGNKMQRINAEKSEKIFFDAVGKIDCFAIMTNTLLRHYKTMAKPEARFLHLPMTVDFSRFNCVTTDVPYKKPYIAYAGTFNNAKDGTDILIKSFAVIAAKYPDLNLYMAGFYHYDVEKQKELIKELGLQDRVTYLGILDKAQIPPYLMNASLTVLPRPDSHQAQGGFPTKLGEYLATGNPVCVTKVGEIPDYLEDNVSAFLAEPGSVDSFADALRRALSDSEKSRCVGKCGRKVAEENFSLDVQSRRLVDWLSSIIQN